ncbi:hypothetical protein [Campylobacter concisus]|nr:hypothetical protein [Campylobacter concisus]
MFKGFLNFTLQDLNLTPISKMKFHIFKLQSAFNLNLQKSKNGI